MIFGSLTLDEATGAILAHSLKLQGLAFKKGRVLSREDIAALEAAGVREVVAAKLEADDVPEDVAATRIAAAVAGDHLTASAAFTGRVNLFADAHGLCVVDRSGLDRLNLVDEAVTVATLPAYQPVEPRQMVATIKIIPFAAPQTIVERCEAIAAAGGPLIRVAPFQALTVALIQTRLPGTKDSVLDKTVEVTRNRLAALGLSLVEERRCDHDAAAVAVSIAEVKALGIDLVLIAGASAITDRRDVLPAGIEQAGGTVDHFGMPVDPGNLMLVGHLDAAPVLGLPGCARSPKLNGFDWVLQRLAAGLEVSRQDLMLMGTGGLLGEIQSRPLPRAAATEGERPVPKARRIGAIVLAAGQSRRMGPANKLLADIGGKPMVARVVDAVEASEARPILVVTGHEAEAVRSTIGERSVTWVHNPDYGNGLSTSLKAGLEALPDWVDAAIVCLGDMPMVSATVLDRLIAAYNPLEGRAICVPTFGGKRGNPVLWDRRFFTEMKDVLGDVGARHLIGAHSDVLCEVAIDDDGVLTDVDTPDALYRLINPDAA